MTKKPPSTLAIYAEIHRRIRKLNQTEGVSALMAFGGVLALVDLEYWLKDRDPLYDKEKDNG